MSGPALAGAIWVTTALLALRVPLPGWMTGPLLAAVMLLAPVELIWVTHVFGPLAGLAGLAVFALLCRRPLARLMRQALGLPRDGFGPGAGEAR